ncbi:hypothetical protein EBU99_14390 [bacterium]|nr:hypothetical protein [bacterium]
MPQKEADRKFESPRRPKARLDLRLITRKFKGLNSRMSSVTLPSTFDVNKITVTIPKVNEKTGAKASYLNYGGEKLAMQTAAEMVLPFGLSVYDKNGTAEYSVELSFRGMDNREAIRQYHDVLTQLDNKMIELGVKNSKLWFKSELNETVIRAFYTPTLKVSKDKEGNLLPYPPTTKAKLRKINGDFEVKLYDENATPYRGVPIEDLLVKGATVTALLECTGVWFAGSKYGLTWKAKQMIIHHLPQKMKDFAFVGFASKPGARTAATAVEDKVEDDEVFEGGGAAAASAPSVVAAMMPSVTKKTVLPPPAAADVDGDDEEDVPAPKVSAAVAATVDEEAQDMEPVHVPVRKPVIKKKVLPVKK